MNHELINLLEQRQNELRTLFSSKLEYRLKRIVFHPIKTLVRLLRLRFFRNWQFRAHTKLFFGYPMTIHSTEYPLWFCGCLGDGESGLQKYLIKYLAESRVFFDIGAHHGYYSLLARRLLPESSKIHTFEPTETHFKLLQVNVEKYENIYPCKLAVSKKAGEKIFYETQGAGSTIERSFFSAVPSFKLSDFKKVNVTAITLDEYCEKKSILPDFLKIDVEGSEYDVLAGGERTIEKCSPIIAMEVWSAPYNNKNHIKAVDLLLSKKYQIFRLTESGDPEQIEYNELLECLEKPYSSDNYLFKK